jgi:SAM-dependent methyltransferase
MVMEVYKEPLYYEIAFSFINPKKQMELFEEFIEEFSEIRVKRFLDIGCGPGLQLREIAKRGCEAVGLDLSPPMLEYLEERAKEESIEIETVKANMGDFELEKRADFAFIMMGTIGYIRSNEEFLTHLNSVANSLNAGGLYLIENFLLDWANKGFFKPESWAIERDGIEVRTVYKFGLKDVLNQIITEEMRLEVDDRGKKLTFKRKDDRKLIFPQELLALVELNKKFEFLGWFERERLKPLRKTNMDNIVLLRKK